MCGDVVDDWRLFNLSADVRVEFGMDQQREMLLSSAHRQKVPGLRHILPIFVSAASRDVLHVRLHILHRPEDIENRRPWLRCCTLHGRQSQQGIRRSEEVRRHHSSLCRLHSTVGHHEQLSPVPGIRLCRVHEALRVGIVNSRHSQSVRSFTSFRISYCARLSSWHCDVRESMNTSCHSWIQIKLCTVGSSRWDIRYNWLT